MKTKSFTLTSDSGWLIPSCDLDSERTLVIAFGSRALADSPQVFAALSAAFPRSLVIGCSTAGEISGAQIDDGSLVVAASKFEATDVRAHSVPIEGGKDSFVAGVRIATELNNPQLRAVFLLSDGLNVNGSQLIAGLNSVLPREVVITGGLAGDGDKFHKTWVLAGGEVSDKKIVAVGLYGDALRVGHGSKGGWDSFGPERVVSKSEDNVLYELNGRPALDVYKEYLGTLASGLPASALLFPLSMRRTSASGEQLVRTVLSIDESKKSMTFAGDIPEGSGVQMMRANFDRLIHGASEAAHLATDAEVTGDSLSIAVSCVGRRLILGERAEEEVEAALESLPRGTNLVGFYSYGEISPLASGCCDLHNQTMTLTTLYERA